MDPKLKALLEKRAKLVVDMRAILDKAEAEGEGRDLNADETKDYNAKELELAGLDSRIKRLEALGAAEVVGDDVVPAASRRQPIRAGGDPAVKEFESFGQFIAAVRFKPNDQRLASLYHENEGVERSAEQNMSDGPSGGFAVPTQFRGELLEVPQQASIIRPRAMVIPAGSPPDAAISMPALDQRGSAAGHMFGGVTVGWIGEGGPKPETDANLRGITLQPKEVAATVTISDKLLRNWAAAGPLLNRLLGGAMYAAEDYSFLRGDGSGKPLGLIGSGAAYGVNRITASKVRLPDILAMMPRLKDSGAGAIWIASRSIMAELLGMRNLTYVSPETGDGALVFIQSAREGEPDRLFGKPVIWNERSPTIGVKGDLVLVDLSFYLIKDGSGPFFAASEHVKFTENKTVIKAFWNVDGQPWLTAPMYQEDNSFQISPFVVLDVPAG